MCNLQVRSDPVLLGEGLGGALYIEDFRRLCNEIGFVDQRVVSSKPIKVSPKLQKYVGEYVSNWIVSVFHVRNEFWFCALKQGCVFFHQLNK